MEYIPSWRGVECLQRDKPATECVDLKKKPKAPMPMSRNNDFLMGPNTQTQLPFCRSEAEAKLSAGLPGWGSYFHRDPALYECLRAQSLAGCY